MILNNHIVLISGESSSVNLFKEKVSIYLIGHTMLGCRDNDLSIVFGCK